MILSFFLKADMLNVQRMALCLRIFQAISGLKVNFSKSSMVGIGVEDSSLGSFAKAMCCSVGS